MNDDELMTLVRDQRAAMPMATPVAEIIGRGHALRRSRRMPTVAGALAGAGVAAAAAVALIPAGHRVPQSTAKLAAYTVTRQADGTVTLTLRQVSHPSGVAAALHGADIPAYVAFADPAPATCAADTSVTAAQQQAIYQFQQGDGAAVITIDPSAIPSGDGLFFFDVPAGPVSASLPGAVEVGGRTVHIGVVHGSQQCALGPAAS